MITTLVFNHAGGVGKTSLVRDLGHALSQRGLRVLLIDADPQANLTDWLGVDSETVHPEQTLLYTFAAKDRALPTPVQTHGMALIPSCVELSQLDTQLYIQKGIDRRLRNALSAVREDYDHVLLDSRPSLGGIPYMLALSAQRLLLPVSTNVKALQAVRETLNLIELIEESGGEMRLALFAATQRHAGYRLDQRVLLELENLRKLAPVSPPLNYRAAVYAQAQESRCPVGALGGGAAQPAILELQALTDAFLEALA